MTLAPGNRRFVWWMAHLALMVLVVQIVAVDHWHAPADDASAKAHAMHCHGASASCADGAALTPANLVAALTPLPPEARLYDFAPSLVSPVDAPVAGLLDPPRAA